MVKPGYKQTEVGEIPEDWKLQRIGDVCTIFGRIGFRGYTINDIVKEGNGAISISPSNIKNGQINLTDNTYLSWEKWRESPEIQISEGDVLLVKTGSTVGKTALVKHLPAPATLNPQLVVFKKRKIDNTILSYILKSKIIGDQIKSTVVGGALPTLSQRQVEKFIFPIPKNKAEISMISSVLNDADELIAGLDRSIAKMCDLKQAAMQQLPTGKTRMPGFTGEWASKRLGELAKIIGGGTPRSTSRHLWNGGIPWCTPTDITNNQDKYLENTERTISLQGLKESAAVLLPKGAILLCTRATIGELKIAARPIATNQGFKSIVCNEGISNEFLYYKLISLRSALIEKASGSTFLEISKKDVSGLEFLVPIFDEQIAIAAILSDMDAQLAALQAQREKLLSIKQGMMQQLLTGRIRLV